ncbi:MAG: hypothetical protein PHG95_03620 [Patescibacteria group bacterium]|nr:hypothetical protein [Patescibacteria group bacterium]
MENKKKATLVKKTTKAKTVKKEPVAKKKTREEIEEMFAFSFGCDCSCCSHHCDSHK